MFEKKNRKLSSVRPNWWMSNYEKVPVDNSQSLAVPSRPDVNTNYRGKNETVK